MAVEKINIRELHHSHGDLKRTVTVEEAKELDYGGMVTIFPNGETAHTYSELLEISRNYPGPEVDVLRFPPMAGG